MASLPRHMPMMFYDIVVQVAIIRPGPIVGAWSTRSSTGGRARRPSCSRTPASSRSKRTLGVPLFQEQLLKIAMVAAGFTGGEAEELRRAMGFKRSEERMGAIETRLRSGMKKNGITGLAQDQIVSPSRRSRSTASGIACGELRAHRLRERVAEGAPPAAFTACL